MRIYFYPINQTAFSVYIDYCKFLMKKSKYEVIILLNKDTYINNNILDELGIRYRVLEKPNDLKKNKALSNVKKNLNKNKNSMIILDFLLSFKDLINKKNQIRKIIKEDKPSFLFISGDREYGYPQILMKQIKKEKGVRVLLSVAISSPEGIAKMRISKNDKQFFKEKKDPILKKIIVNINKKWVYSYKRKEYLFYTPGKSLAGYILGYIAKDPWIMGKGLVDYISINGDKYYKEYTDKGVKKEKLIYIGHPSYDEIYDFDSIKLLKEKYNIIREDKKLIFAVPQIAEHNLASWEESYEILDKICEQLEKYRGKILLALHPKSKYENYKYIENKFGFTIVKEPLNKIISSANIFIATFSSTIDWATVLGIPSIVVDFYDMNYSMFDGYKGVKVTNKYKELKKCIIELQDDSEHYKKISDLQLEKGKEIAKFDGKNRERLKDFIKKTEVKIWY